MWRSRLILLSQSSVQVAQQRQHATSTLPQHPSSLLNTTASMWTSSEAAPCRHSCSGACKVGLTYSGTGRHPPIMMTAADLLVLQSSAVGQTLPVTFSPRVRRSCGADASHSSWRWSVSKQTNVRQHWKARVRPMPFEGNMPNTVLKVRSPATFIAADIQGSI